MLFDFSCEFYHALNDIIIIDKKSRNYVTLYRKSDAEYVTTANWFVERLQYRIYYLNDSRTNRLTCTRFEMYWQIRFVRLHCLSFGLVGVACGTKRTSVLDTLHRLIYYVSVVWHIGGIFPCLVTDEVLLRAINCIGGWRLVQSQCLIRRSRPRPATHVIQTKQLMWRQRYPTSESCFTFAEATPTTPTNGHN